MPGSPREPGETPAEARVAPIKMATWSVTLRRTTASYPRRSAIEARLS
jgi:hypothetical protein